MSHLAYDYSSEGHSPPNSRDHYIGYFDMLGAKNLMKEGQTYKLWRKIRWLQRKACRTLHHYNGVAKDIDNYNYAEGGWEPSCNEMKCITCQDGIYLLAEPGWSNQLDSFFAITNVLSSVYSEALNKGILVRGALGVGMVCFDESVYLILGEGIASVLEHEQSQEWAGISVCDKITEVLGRPRKYLGRYRPQYQSRYYGFTCIEPKLVAYPVPRKIQAVPERLEWTIPCEGVNIGELERKLSLCDDPGVYRKIQNTITFVKALQSHDSSPGGTAF